MFVIHSTFFVKGIVVCVEPQKKIWPWSVKQNKIKQFVNKKTLSSSSTTGLHSSHNSFVLSQKKRQHNPF